MGGDCPLYGDLRADYPDMEDDDQLLGLFSAILERRGRLEDEERAMVGGPTPLIYLVQQNKPVPL